MDLLERNDLADRMAAKLTAARTGRGSVVCLFGEAGAGKTAFTRLLASSFDARTLWGACEDLATPEALGPLRDWAREAGHSALDGIPQAGRRIELFSEVLAALSSECTLAVIEDLHWADDATLDLVSFLGRRLEDKPMVLLVTSRNDDRARSRLRRKLAQIPANVRASFDMANLSMAAVAQLERAAGKSSSGLYQLTGGNAFFVTEVLRCGEAIPETVRDAVLASFDRLSDRARRALEAASIFPRRVEAETLRAVCPDAADGVLEAVDAGLLLATKSDYSFRHEIARRAVEGGISAERRRSLNQAALAVLRADTRSSNSRLAHHAEAAGDAATVAAVAPVAAAEAAGLGAHREAARHYRSALDFTSGLDVGERAQLFEKYAFELHLLGEVGEAIRAQEAALELRRRAGDRVAEGNCLRWISRLKYFSGDRVSADHFAREALSLLEAEEPGAELAMAYSNLGQLAMLAEQSTEALNWSEKAIGLADRLRRRDILSHSLNNAGGARRWIDKAAARGDLARSLRIALEDDLPEHAARSYTNAAFHEINWLEHAAAHRILDAGLAYCEARDLDAWRCYMNGCRAQLLSREGRWGEAANLALAQIADDQSTPLLRFPAIAALARVRMRRGDPEVEPLLHSLEAYLETGNEPPQFVVHACVAAEYSWITGEPTEHVRDRLLRATELARTTGDVWSEGELWFWARQIGIECTTPADAAPPYRLLFDGKWAEAAAAWSALECPYDRALALMSGDEAARREGLASLDSLGARAVADRYRRDLKERGFGSVPRGPQTATRSNPVGLTRRQMDVLGLVAEGLSNGEIAERLFISSKTVDHHVSAILGKLDSHSRGQAVALARSVGLI